MTSQEEAPVVPALDGKNARLGRGGHQFQLRDLQNVFLGHLHIPGVGGVKHIVQPPKEGRLLFDGRMGIHTEELGVPQDLGYAVVIV